MSDIIILQIGPTGPSGPRGVVGPKGPSGFAPFYFDNTPSGIWPEIYEGFDHNSLTPTGAYFLTTGIAPSISSNSIGPSGPIGQIGDMGEVGPSGPVGPKGPAGLPPVRETLVSGLLVQEFLLPSCFGSSLQSGSLCIGLSGSMGFSGLLGPTGPSGSIGLSGPSGPRGQDLLSGIHCFVKAIAWKSIQTGNQIIQTPFNFNEISASDLTGISGPRGSIGPRGLNSISGPSGLPGAVGLIGPMGRRGLNGLSGDRGLTGDIGPSGPAGRSLGFSGPRGQTGPSGPRGFSGPQGSGGPSGPIGLDLSSGLAYSFVYASENPLENGRRLINLYNENISRPNFTIILTPGIYDLSGRNLNLKDRLKIVGFGSPDSIKIQSSFPSQTVGVLNQEGDNIYLENISIQNTYTGNINDIVCPQDVIFCNRTNTYLSRNPNNNCEFPACSGEWQTQEDLFVDYRSPANRSAFSNSYISIANINLSGNSLNTFIKSFSSSKDIAFISLSEDQNKKDLVLLRRSFFSLSPEIQEAIVPSGVALASRKTKISSSGLEGNDIPVWLLIAGNVIYDHKNKRILSIQNEEILLIEKSRRVYSSSSSEVFGFCAWPWYISDVFVLGSNAALNNYNISLPFRIKLNTIKNSIFKNVKFLETINSQDGVIDRFSFSMQQGSYYGGKFINCEAGINSFGGDNGYLVGEFINCKSKNGGFTAPTQHSDITMSGVRLINCEISNSLEQNEKTFVGFGIGSDSFNNYNLSLATATSIKTGIIDGEFRNLIVNDLDLKTTGSRDLNTAPLHGYLSSGSYLNNAIYLK